MNEKAFQDAYKLFVENGYTKSPDDFRQLINENPKALSDSYKIFQSGGYSKSIEDYKALLGVGVEEPGFIDTAVSYAKNLFSGDDEVKKKDQTVSTELPSDVTPLASSSEPKTDLEIATAKARGEYIPPSGTLQEQIKAAGQAAVQTQPKKEEPKKEKPKEPEVSYLKNLYTNLGLGASYVNEAVASLPETVINVLAIPQNFIAEKTGWNIGTNADEVKKNLGITNPLLDWVEESQKVLSGEVARYNAKNYTETGIVDNFKKGNYQDGFELLGSSITQSVPISIGMMIGGAYTTPEILAAVSTLGLTNQQRQDLEEMDPTMAESEKTMKALGMSAAESVFSAIGEGTIGKVYRDIAEREGKEAAKGILQKGLVETYKRALEKGGMAAGFAGEGIEEAATQITQNVISGKPAFEGAADAFVTGAGSGVVFTAPISVINAKSYIKNKAETYSTKDKIGNILKDKADDIDNLYNVPVVSEITSEQLEIASLGKSRDILLNNLKKAVKSGKITPDDAKQSLFVFDKISQVANAVKDLDVSVEDKAKIATLLSQRNDLKTKIENKDDVLVVQEKQQIELINNQIQEILSKPKLQQDAIQEQAAGQVPVQPTAGGRQEMAQGEPQAESEVTTQEGQAEEVVAGEPTDANYAVAQEVNNNVAKANPEASVLLTAKGDDLSLTAVYVGKEKRGKGIGTKVLETVKAEADRTGKKIVLDATNELDADTDLERLNAFYEKNGFKKVGENKFEYNPKEAKPTRTIDEEVSMLEGMLDQADTDASQGVSVSNKSQVAQLESKTTDTKRKAIIRAAIKAVNTLKSIFPDMDIVLHDNEASYDAQMGKDKGRAGSAGNFAVMRNSKGNIVGGRIDINLNRSNMRTVAHEVAHAVMLKAFGDNPALFSKFRARISKVLSASTLNKLNDFASQYSETESFEEFLVELSAALTENEQQLSKVEPSTIQKIADIINDIVSALTNGKIIPFEGTVRTNELIEFLNTMSAAIGKGEELKVKEVDTKGAAGKIVSKSSIKNIDVNKIRTLSRAGNRVSKGLSIRKVNKEKVVQEAEDLTLEYVKEKAPKVFISNANLISKYPIIQGIKKFGEIKNIQEAQEVYDIFTRQIADNLKFLMDNFKKEFREIATLWYDGANILAQNFSKKYGVTTEQAAGIIASLSPQKDWYQNVRLAEMVMMAFKENPVMTKEMVDKQRAIIEIGLEPYNTDLNNAKLAYKKSRSKANSEKLKKELESTKKYTEKTEKVLQELSGLIGTNMSSVRPEMKAYYVRLFHEINTTKDYDVLSPDGNVIGVAKKKDGSNAQVAWGSYGEIGKAVSIYLDGSQENITRALGEMHKIRNFYNNIIDPMSPDRDVTMDTHAVAAALMLPLSGNSRVVKANFGTNTANSAPLGIKGLYYAFAEGYNLAAKETGLLPRQVQSITWEAVRGLFTDAFKRDSKKVADINKIVEDYVNKKITLDEARNQITEYAGGIKDPTWAGGPLQEESEDDVEGGADGRGDRSDGPDTVGTTQTTTSKSQLKQPTAGNRLFNEPIKEIASIADRYYKRVFGKDRPKYSGTKILDKEKSKRISDAFIKMKHDPFNPEVKKSYNALAKEVIDQYKAFLDAGYSVEINNEESYNNSQEMIDDLRNNNRIKIFSTKSGFGNKKITDTQRRENPMLNDSSFKDVNGVPLLINDVFRAVHDFYGHAELGNSFGPKGEENAWNVHSRMFSPLARKAMTTETRGQNSFVNFSGINEQIEKLRDKARELRKNGNEKSAQDVVAKIYELASFADQKIGLLPEEFYTINEKDTGDTVVSKSQKTITEKDVTIKKGKDFQNDGEHNILYDGKVIGTMYYDGWWRDANYTSKNAYDIYGDKIGDSKKEAVNYFVDKYNSGPSADGVKSKSQVSDNAEKGKYKVAIMFKGKYGGMVAKPYEFNNRQHFENWMKKYATKFGVKDYYEMNSRSQLSKVRGAERVVELGRGSGFSDDAIRTVLQKKGYTQSEIDAAMKTKKAAETIVVDTNFVKDYDNMMEAVDEKILDGLESGEDNKTILDNVMSVVEKSEAYKNATDQQREQITRDVKEAFGEKMKSAPSAKKLLGFIKDVKNITMTEMALLKKQFSDMASGAKGAKSAITNATRALVASLKDLRKGGVITDKQMLAVLRKFSKTNVLDAGSVDKFVDYMTKVFNDAEYAEKISNALSKVKKAKKNIKTKIGISERLYPLLNRIFSINPSLIPDAVFDQYMELLEMFSQKDKVLSLANKDLTTSVAMEVIDAIDEELSISEELAIRFDEYQDKVVDSNGKLDYAATLEAMLKDGVITDDEAKMMKKYKSKIVPPSQKVKKTEAELEQERQDLIKAVGGVDIDTENLPTNDEREVARKLDRLTKSDAVKEMTIEQLTNLLKVVDNINNGYLPHYAQLMLERLNAINNGSFLAKLISIAKPLSLTKVYANLKGIFTRKEAITEMVRRSPLYYIDQVFGNFKTKDIFNSLFKAAAEAETLFRSNLNKIQNRLDESQIAVARSFGFDPNKTLISKFKMMAYMVQLEYESNPNSKQVNSAAEHLKATIKHIDEGKSSFGERDANMLQEILDNYSENGEINTDKLFRSFNEAERNAIKTIRDINDSLVDKAVHTSAIIRGDKINLLKNYVHLNVLHATEPNDAISGVSSATEFNNSLRPSTKAKSLISRTGKVTPLNFDVFASAQRGAKFVLMDYYLTEPIRTARKTINEAKDAMERDGRIPKEKRQILNAISSAFEESTENLLNNAFVSNSFADEVVNFLSKSGYRAVLASAPRFVAELTSNISFALFSDPSALVSGFKYRDVVMSSDAVKILNNLGSKQTNRIFPHEALVGRFIDSSIMSQASGIKGGRANSDVANVIQKIYNNSIKKYKNSVELVADTLISTPDKIVMRPLWIGSFANEFKRITGKDIDFEKVAANDEAYMLENRDALDDARDIADQRSVLTGATDNAYMDILKGKVKPNQSALSRAFNIFNNYMTRFAIYEYTTARTGIMAAMGNGSLSRKQGVALMAGVTTRMMVYTLLAQTLGSSMVEMFTGDDEEEDEKSLLQKVGQAAASTFTSLLIGRDFGNATKTFVNYGLERFNENYLDELRNGDYDPYKDAIQYTVVPPDTKGKKTDLNDFLMNMGGPFGPSLKTANLIARKLTEEPKKKEDAIERSRKESEVRIPLEILGNVGLIPMYKDVRKVVMKDIYKDIGKADKAKEDESRKENVEKIKIINKAIDKADDKDVIRELIKIKNEVRGELLSKEMSQEAKAILEQRKKRKKAKYERLLGGYDTREDLKRNNPDLYEQNFGEDSKYYKENEPEMKARKLIGESRQEYKDEMYNRQSARKRVGNK